MDRATRQILEKHLNDISEVMVFTLIHGNLLTPQNQAARQLILASKTPALVTEVLDEKSVEKLATMLADVGQDRLAKAVLNLRNPTSGRFTAYQSYLYPVVTGKDVLVAEPLPAPDAFEVEKEETPEEKPAQPPTAELLQAYGDRRKISTGFLRTMETLARVDQLTNVHNRRTIIEILDDESSRFLRYGQPMSILMFCVDDFKGMMDLYGQPAVEIVLETIARVIRSIVRDVDQLGRYGREEFLLLLPASSADAARAVAERLRKTIENENIPIGLGREISVTVSMGIAEIMSVDSIVSLVRRASEALDEAKALGGNSVYIKRK